MSEYFPEPKSLGKVKVESDLSNHATRTDIKNATGIDTSSFAKKVDLASLKSDVDKLHIDNVKNIPTNLNNLKSKVNELDVDKLLPAPVDLRQLSGVVNDVGKKDVYNAKIKNNEDKIPATTNLATKASLNAKIHEVKGEIPNITNLAAASSLAVVGNKIPNVAYLGKKQKQLSITQKLMKLKRKSLIIIRINILLFQNSIG